MSTSNELANAIRQQAEINAGLVERYEDIIRTNAPVPVCPLHPLVCPGCQQYKGCFPFFEAPGYIRRAHYRVLAGS